MIDFRPQSFLGEGYSPMFGAWLADPGPGGAAGELARAMTAAGSGQRGLAGSGWRPREMVESVLPPDQQARLRENVRRLTEGSVDVVVTGQQPGFLGGPLYTLYKIATAVALARRRTDAGFPTLAVFWSADDDSDLGEALAPLAWDPRQAGFLRAGGRDLARDPSRRGRMVGTLPCRPVFGHAVEVWPDGAAGDVPDLATDLGVLLRRAVDQEWTLGQFNTAAWYRCWAEEDLVVISGDDPGLHKAAAPLTYRLRPMTGELSDLARQRGRELTRAGWHAQLDERSLRHPWYRSDGSRRLPVATDEQVAPERLRPGVLTRSLIQDWLLAPVCVVVGPGEYAYLRQLEPVYEAVGVPRCPLVPRLAGTIVPRGMATGVGARPAAPRADAAGLAAGYLESATDQLARLLRDELGLDDSESCRLAAGRTRRWRRGLEAMLADRMRRGDGLAGLPAWVQPEYRLQERTLAAFNALGLWGSALREGVFRGADHHLDQGGQGTWQALRWEVEEPGAES